MTSSNGMALKRSKASDIDLMTPISTLPALWSKSFSNGNQKPVLVPNTEPDSVPVISRSVVIKRDLKSRSTVPTTRKPVQPVYQNNQKKAKKKTGGRQSFQGVAVVACCAFAHVAISKIHIRCIIVRSSKHFTFQNFIFKLFLTAA